MIYLSMYHLSVISSSIYLIYLYHLYFSVIYPSVTSSVHHIIDTLCYPKVSLQDSRENVKIIHD